MDRWQIEFLVSCPPYFLGDKAGFPQDIAEGYVDKKAARHVKTFGEDGEVTWEAPEVAEPVAEVEIEPETPKPPVTAAPAKPVVAAVAVPPKPATPA